jgi:hypothetical protein
MTMSQALIMWIILISLGIDPCEVVVFRIQASCSNITQHASLLVVVPVSIALCYREAGRSVNLLCHCHTKSVSGDETPSVYVFLLTRCRVRKQFWDRL